MKVTFELEFEDLEEFLDIMEVRSKLRGIGKSENKTSEDEDGETLQKEPVSE